MNERTLLRAVFDALPSLVFVVDRDVRIHDYNAAAAELIMAERETVLRRRAGEILHCIHSTEVPEGCGWSPACKDCIIRSSVVKAFLGNRVVRRKARIEYIRDGRKVELFALVTASPFYFNENPHALLVIEDISEIAALYRMIFLCPVCGKMQDEKKTWMRVESYFKNHWDIDCSHNYCPDCFQREMDIFRAEKDDQEM
ncbi:PAS domain-containing protein [Candidatus Electronema sp. PJ]|uniref:PAS domain-containing protein n=1 Tax=Candidatus Electronema sp. PJ TaxID=3401572 RepID=UPI003AA7B6F6